MSSVDADVLELAGKATLEDINSILDAAWCESLYPCVEGHNVAANQAAKLSEAAKYLKLAKDCDWVDPELNKEAAKALEDLESIRSNIHNALQIIKTDPNWKENLNGHYAKIAADAERETRNIAAFTQFLTAIKPSPSNNLTVYSCR